MEHFDIDMAAKAQERLCDEKGAPLFAPRNGRCFRCGRNIYTEVMRPGLHRKTGISVETAGKMHITGCPHCNYSYCN